MSHCMHEHMHAAMQRQAAGFVWIRLGTARSVLLAMLERAACMLQHGELGRPFSRQLGPAGSRWVGQLRWVGPVGFHSRTTLSAGCRSQQHSGRILPVTASRGCSVLPVNPCLGHPQGLQRRAGQGVLADELHLRGEGVQQFLSGAGVSRAHDVGQTLQAQCGRDGPRRHQHSPGHQAPVGVPYIHDGHGI
jgi:hypothetical protein|eukprot:COSAG01_NODE_1621_length_9711_cov_55.630292_9_plen_191_part_00